MDAASPAAKHELFITGGNPSFQWAMADSGVALSESGLSFTLEGRAQEQGFSDILSIRLHRASAGTGANVGVCQIRFRDGSGLIVYGGAASGLADETQNTRFASFVHDLHKRLAAREDAKRISFNAGLSEGRYTILTIAIVASAILFGVVPLILLIMMRDLHTFILFAGASGLLWSFYRLWEKNRPRPYSPAHVPEELLAWSQ